MTAVPLFAYVGSRTTRERNARGDGITVFRVDEERGTLDRLQTVADLTNPSFLALNARGNRLYTVHGDGHEISVPAGRARAAPQGATLCQAALQPLRPQRRSPGSNAARARGRGT